MQKSDKYLLICFSFSGLYIGQNRADVPEKFRGIGIRIEDNILITESQPVVLSASCPKHPDDIENIMSQR